MRSALLEGQEHALLVFEDEKTLKKGAKKGIKKNLAGKILSPRGKKIPWALALLLQAAVVGVLKSIPVKFER